MPLARFQDKWGSVDYPPEPVSETDLRAVEQHFGVALPADYRRAALQTGLPSPTSELLGAIVERELDIADLGDFISAEGIVQETLDWREIGMPDQLIAFANDSSGNKFCFDAERLKARAPDGGTIWFFDHDFDTVEAVAPSFDAWINAYCEIEPF